MPTPDFILKLTASARSAYGGVLTIGSKTFPMTTRTLERREREYIPEGFENAGSADLRVFKVTPTDFPVWPDVGSVLFWQEVSYTVIAVRPEDDAIGKTLITLLFFCYKTPAPDSETSAPQAEAMPGQRKQYYPPPSTL